MCYNLQMKNISEIAEKASLEISTIEENFIKKTLKAHSPTAYKLLGVFPYYFIANLLGIQIIRTFVGSHYKRELKIYQRGKLLDKLIIDHKIICQ